MHIIVALAAMAAPRPSDPHLVGPEAPVPAGQIVPLEIHAAANAGVRVDGCVPVELERREGDVWKPLPRAACDKPIAAKMVEKDLTVSLTAPDPGEYRAVMAWGRSCTADLPFAVAACAQTGFVRSEPFTVVSADAHP